MFKHILNNNYVYSSAKITERYDRIGHKTKANAMVADRLIIDRNLILKTERINGFLVNGFLILTVMAIKYRIHVDKSQLTD